MPEEWYKSWFDSPYYSLLYKHRDAKEAQQFVNQLMHHLNLPSGAKVIDLACGNGRHAVYLNKLGFEVVGIDLSKNKIVAAQRLANPTLRFQQGDIRRLEFEEKFRLALNLFTSIGYFSDFSENQQVLSNVRNILDDQGLLVIDFLNATKVERELVASEKHEMEGVIFEIRRQVKKHMVEKLIRITDGDRMVSYREAVQLIHLKDFDRMLKKERFQVTELWGDYYGGPFDEIHSDRLILFAKAI
jgi:SAM-dependent methyltransferase